jgi:hypothetical protein
MWNETCGARPSRMAGMAMDVERDPRRAHFAKDELEDGGGPKPHCTERPGARPLQAVPRATPQGTNPSPAGMTEIMLLTSYPIPVYTLQRTLDIAQTAGRGQDHVGNLPTLSLHGRGALAARPADLSLCGLKFVLLTPASRGEHIHCRRTLAPSKRLGMARRDGTGFDQSERMYCCTKGSCQLSPVPIKAPAWAISDMIQCRYLSQTWP